MKLQFLQGVNDSFRRRHFEMTSLRNYERGLEILW